jgi:hypothetical protein
MKRLCLLLLLAMTIATAADFAKQMEEASTCPNGRPVNRNRLRDQSAARPD